MEVVGLLYSTSSDTPTPGSHLSENLGAHSHAMSDRIAYGTNVSLLRSHRMGQQNSHDSVSGNIGKWLAHYPHGRPHGPGLPRDNQILRTCPRCSTQYQDIKCG